MRKTAILAISFSLLLLGSTTCFVGCSKNNKGVTSVSITTDVACPNCQGLGRSGICLCFEKSPNANPNCDLCSGSGTVLCGFCNGRGTVPQDAVSLVEERMEVQRKLIEAKRQERELAKQRELERIEQERLEREQRERERIAAEQRERERQARIAAEQRERERIAAEQMERERQARIAAEQRERERQVRIAEEQRERERLEQKKIAAERAERKLQEFWEQDKIPAEIRKKWDQAYDMIEKGMDVDRVLTLLDEQLGVGDDVVFKGNRTNKRNGTFEWVAQPENIQRSISVRLSFGKVIEKSTLRKTERTK